MDRKLITLKFSMEQVCNDVLARCYVVSQGMVDEAQKDIRANIESPDSDRDSQYYRPCRDGSHR